MIQRIQTVYLAVAALLLMMPVIFNFTWATLNSDNEVLELTAASIIRVGEVTETVQSTFPVAGAIALALLATVYATMQYKDRKFQMKLTQAAMVLNLAAGAVVFYYADSLTSLADGGSVSYSPAIAIFLVNAVLCFLAYRGIRKDDELVRSADRLR